MPVALCSRLFLLSDFGIRVGESLHVFMLSDSGQIKEPDYALCLVLCDVDLISSVTSPMPAQFYCVCAIQSAEPQREEHVMVTRPTSRNWALGLFFVSSLDTLLPLAMSYEAHK
ncbi:hypothetical protein BRADI_4g21274v3 [Brachypodium distachyon]|uniref:Uncharacterized protein n=1 Tax=Brachypodium distachyon TaxID=15368 RepID=A0A2K2CP56_BRADI|nr:hypothetical protein BRADI_4g21274v3 [Brachypodium distachyon]